MNAEARRVHDIIEAEIDRRHEQYKDDPPWPAQRISRRWYRKGSAGKALGWFDEIADAHPEASIEELAQLLLDRCEQELTSHSRQWFTRRHLAGVVEIVWNSREPVSVAA